MNELDHSFVLWKTIVVTQVKKLPVQFEVSTVMILRILVFWEVGLVGPTTWHPWRQWCNGVLRHQVMLNCPLHIGISQKTKILKKLPTFCRAISTIHRFAKSLHIREANYICCTQNRVWEHLKFLQPLDLNLNHQFDYYPPSMGRS